MTNQAATKKEVALEKVEPASNKFSPMFVEAEKMFERMADIARDTGARAYEFFRARGGEFGRELEDWFRAENEILRPVPIEIKESEGNLFVTAAVPGFKPEEIEVSIKDNVLILSGTTTASEKKENADTIISEWSSNKFCRQLILPTPVIADKVEAKLNNGMLELMLPKAAEHEATKVAVTSS